MGFATAQRRKANAREPFLEGPKVALTQGEIVEEIFRALSMLIVDLLRPWFKFLFDADHFRADLAQLANQCHQIIDMMSAFVVVI
jgi:hypothetical protein